jgi:hypothetical protein
MSLGRKQLHPSLLATLAVLLSTPGTAAGPDAAIEEAPQPRAAEPKGRPNVLLTGLEDFLPMFAGHRYLVLGHYTATEDDTFPEDAWGIGPVLVEWNADSFRRLASRAVDAQRVPPEIRAWRGRKLSLFDAGGRKCQTTITGLRIASQRRADDAESPTGRITLPASAWSAEDDHYQMREFRPHLLLAEVDFPAPCRGALWGRPAERPLPKVTRARAPGKALMRAALRAFRRLPEYRELQAEFTAQRAPSAPRHWDENQAASSSQRILRWFPSPSGRGGLMVVSSDSMNCGEGFVGHLYAIFTVDPIDRSRPRLKLRTKGALEFFSPDAAFDIDGDGRPEFLEGDTLVRWRDNRYVEMSLPSPFIDPC